MKIFIKLNGDILKKGTTSNGYASERTVTKKVGKELKSILESKGHKVWTAGGTEKVYESGFEALVAPINKANMVEAEMMISLKASCNSNYEGTNVFTSSDVLLNKGIEVTANLSDLFGFKRTRTKTTGNYIDFKKFNGESIIIDLFRPDDVGEYRKYSTVSAKAIAEAIAKGILGE